MGDIEDRADPGGKWRVLPPWPSSQEWTTGRHTDPVPGSVLAAEERRVLREALDAGG